MLEDFTSPSLTSTESTKQAAKQILKYLNEAGLYISLQNESTTSTSNNQTDYSLIMEQAISNLVQQEGDVKLQNALLQDSLEQLRSVQDQIVKSEKLASIGQLAAGITHEINNPIGFIYSNLEIIKDYLSELRTTDINRDKLDEIIIELEDMTLDSIEGCRRVKEIISDLGEYARTETKPEKCISINEIITKSVSLCKNKVRYSANIITNIKGDLSVDGRAGQLQQVVVNLIMNAAQAIDEVNSHDDSTSNSGIINIGAYIQDNVVFIEVADNGKGMERDIINKIFDPFFTTKPVGVGTGMGLSISLGIVNSHNGKISVSSDLNIGTCFTIQLPASIHKSS